MTPPAPTLRFIVRGPRRSGTTWTRVTFERAYADHPNVIVDDRPWRHGTFEDSPAKEIAVVKEPYGWTLSYHNYLNGVRESNGLDPIDKEGRVAEEVRAWVERWCRKVDDWMGDAAETRCKTEGCLIADKLLVRYWDLIAYADECFEAVATTLGLPDPPDAFEPPTNRVDSGGRVKDIPFERDYWLKRRYVDELPTPFRQGCRRALRQNRQVLEDAGFSEDVPEVQP